MPTIHVVVVTPERTTLDQTAEMVIVPLMDGEAGILAGHAPMIGRLAPGELRVVSGSKTQRLYVDGGFAQVADNTVSVLTGRSVPVEQLDTTEARKTLEQTQIYATDKADVIEIKNKSIAQARAQIRLASSR